MSNPIILYDNRFEDGDLSATNTATGYDVNNIKDLRGHTFWKANAAGTLYITEAPLTKDTLAQEEMRISPADGYAGVYLPASLDLTPYLGDRIVCLDSALKKHIGYIKSVGTDKALNIIAAADDGISVPDDDDIDIGAHDFAIVLDVSLQDWTPAANQYLFGKFVTGAGATGYYGGLNTDGKIFLICAGDGVFNISAISTVATGKLDGTDHEIAYRVVRETASAAGSVTIVLDGVQLGNPISITAAATKSLANNAALYLAGKESGTRYGCVVKRFRLYNYAPTVANLLTLYQTGEVAAADQYGSQTNKCTNGELTTATTGYGGVNGTRSRVDSEADPGTSSVPAGAEDKWVLKSSCTSDGVTHAITVPLTNFGVAGQRVEVSFLYYVPTGSPDLRISYYAGAWSETFTTIEGNLTTKDAWTLWRGYVNAIGQIKNLQIFQNAADTGELMYFDKVNIKGLGATLDLNESGIGDTDWQDSSTNNLDAAYPASGSAVVLFNNIVSTPGGSTYNWESKESGFNHADAAGYAYKISESDSADALGIEGHNLGTAGAAVSLESTDDESTWTERLAAFNPSDDTAILKTMTSFQAASKRLKIVTASVAPYLAVAMLGNKLEFNRGAYIGDGAIVPWQFGIVASAQRSKTGNLLGNSIRYKPIDISMTIPTDTYDWFNEYFWPFWRDHGSELKPFFFAPDLTTFTDKIFWMQLTEDSVLAPPMLVKDRVDRYTFTMRGVLEI